MREGQFIRENTDKWKRMESEIRRPDVHPDTLAHDYIVLTDDLSYARTFYPQGESVAFLNNLTRLFHQKIYTNKKDDRGRVLWFWKYDLPCMFFRYRKYFLYSFLFFLFFLLLGIVSAKYDEDFTSLILGDRYVNMTLNNIKRGDPFGVYKEHGQLVMFIFIAFNNIKVCFTSFVSGIIAGVGPLFINIQNAIMLGVFEYLFFSKGLGWDSLSVIFLHGTIEIWSIIIGISAGMILGNGILFPGTYSRGKALQTAARDGMKLVFGLVPFFLIAAFFESFVTRYASMPLVLRLLIVLGSLCFLIWYFIIYPILLNKKIIASQNNNITNQTSLQLWQQQKSNSEK